MRIKNSVQIILTTLFTVNFNNPVLSVVKTDWQTAYLMSVIYNGHLQFAIDISGNQKYLSTR